MSLQLRYSIFMESGIYQSSEEALNKYSDELKSLSLYSLTKIKQKSNAPSMAYFQIFPSTPNTRFESLLRLLDADKPSVSHCSHPHVRPFSTKFDVREGAQSYKLHGELPDITSEDIDIEFADNDSNALTIKGRTEREHKKSSEIEGNKKSINRESHHDEKQ